MDAREVDAILQGLFDSDQAVWPLGWMAASASAGADVTIRFRASLRTTTVVVHIQRTGTGGPTYSTVTFVSETEVDCREGRQKDFTFSRDGTNRYYVWLIPKLKEQGIETLFDGVDGDDKMAFYDVGT